MAFIIFFLFFLKKLKKLELSPQNFHYDVLHLLYSVSQQRFQTLLNFCCCALFLCLGNLNLVPWFLQSLNFNSKCSSFQSCFLHSNLLSGNVRIAPNKIASSHLKMGPMVQCILGKMHLGSLQGLISWKIQHDTYNFKNIGYLSSYSFTERFPIEVNAFVSQG